MLAILALAVLPYFVVHVVDAETGRGVPLIELRTMNETGYWTDSAGVAAIHEPSLEGREALFKISGHGYVFDGKWFDEPGAVLRLEAGKSVTLKVRRTMIAERLYRITGEGIYRDSELAGIRKPREWRGLVAGQDTVSMTPYRGRLYWIWGDTMGPRHMNFQVAGGWSSPADDPDQGIALRYFVNGDGFAKAMLPLKGEGLVWIEGLFTARDPEGKERLLATYTRQMGLKPPVERGVARFNDSTESFEPWVRLPWLESHFASHPVRLTEGGREYWYFYPWLRVENSWAAIADAARWERREAILPESLRFNSVAWNEYRKKWILLATRTGEVWYAEGERPEGPFSKPVKIVEHNNYNFYNVAHHPYFDRDGGRVIYFEGTYTSAFSGAKTKTPRYDYNQVMYRLRLDDARLR